MGCGYFYVFDLQFMCAVVFIYLRICVSRSRNEMGDLECALDHQAAFYFKTAKYMATHTHTHTIRIEFGTVSDCCFLYAICNMGKRSLSDRQSTTTHRTHFIIYDANNNNNKQ